MGKRKSEEVENANPDAEEPTADQAKRPPLKTPTELAGEADTWATKCTHLIPIAYPLASRSLAKKLYKLIRKSTKQKAVLRRGVREVQKFVRKGERGIVVLAGNTRPIDVISHMPVVCEEAQMAYCFLPSKQDLGLACCSRRNTCAIMVKKTTDLGDLYDSCVAGINALPIYREGEANCGVAETNGN